MSAMRAKAILLMGIAAAGTAVFSLADVTAGSRDGGGFNPGGSPAPGSGVQQDFVQLPNLAGAPAPVGLPKPTGAPPTGDAGRPEDRESADETVAVLDPYNG